MAVLYCNHAHWSKLIMDENIFFSTHGLNLRSKVFTFTIYHYCKASGKKIKMFQNVKKCHQEQFFIIINTFSSHMKHVMDDIALTEKHSISLFIIVPRYISHALNFQILTTCPKIENAQKLI